MPSIHQTPTHTTTYRKHLIEVFALPSGYRVTLRDAWVANEQTPPATMEALVAQAQAEIDQRIEAAREAFGRELTFAGASGNDRAMRIAYRNIAALEALDEPEEAQEQGEAE